MSIRISGILKDGIGKPIPNCTIELISKKTTLNVITKTEANLLIDSAGSYSMNVEPSEYSVSLYIEGFSSKYVGNIRVYSDSRPGTLNDFLMLPGESDLTPELVQIFQQLRDESKIAAADSENSRLASELARDKSQAIQNDITGKLEQVNQGVVDAETSRIAAEAAAGSAQHYADKTSQDVLTTLGFKNDAEQATTNALLSATISDENAVRAEGAANLVKMLSADAATLPASAEATVTWDADTNTLSLGIPQGIKGDTGSEGVQGIQGIQGEQGVKGDKGDKGDTGPEAQLSPLLIAISALDTAAEQIICLTGKDNAATTALTELGRKLIAATSMEVVRQEIGAAADSKVLKIENNLSEFSTAAAKKQAVDNLGIGDVLTVSNSVYRKSGEAYKFNENNYWGWNFFGGDHGEGLVWTSSSPTMNYSSHGLELSPAGGAFADWRKRGAAMLVLCPNALVSAYSVWKAIQHGRDYIAGFDVHLPASGQAMAQMHIGTAEFSYYANGDSSQSGSLNCRSVVQISDRNKKHDIEDIVNPDEIVMSWTGKTFKLNNNDQLSAGIIAQDIVEKFPAAVTVLPDGSLGVDYSTLQAPMIESMKNRISKEAELLERIRTVESQLIRIVSKD